MKNIHPSLILVIDDDTTMLKVIPDLLKDLNYKTAIARTGAMGIKQAKLLHPDLILLDVLMPDMDGFETCRRLKADDVTKHIPIVFLTVLSSVKDTLKGFDVGGVDYLTKPVQFEELFARLNIHLTISTLQQQLQGKNAQLQAEISQHEQTEKALQESEQRYRAVVEDQTEFICRFSLDGTLRFVNQAYCRYFGKKPKELIGKSFFLLIPEEDREVVHTCLADLSKNQPVGMTEHRVLRPDGETGWQQWTNRVIVDGQGQVIEFQAVGHDITAQRCVEEELDRYHENLYDLVQEQTAELMQSNSQLHQEIDERKRIENALRKSEQQYRFLAERVGYGLAIVQDGQIVFVNTPLANILKYPKEHLIGKSAGKLFHQVSPEERNHKLQQLLNRDIKEFTRQSRWVNGAGEDIWIEGQHSLLDWHGKPAVLVTVRDITDHKRWELEVQKREAQLERENIALRATLQDCYKFEELVGKSRAMQEVYRTIIRAASSEASVLICGESGTGKELVARTIHKRSARHDQPCVAVNCGAVLESLFEREFFGHRKGAFTGADRDRPGYFDRAHKGTLFLDEIGELKPGLQVKLLRVLDDNEYLPVGDTISKKVDVRIIAATNKDLKEQLRKGLIREDFYYRIRVIVINLPPLRDRKEDIPLLIDHFLNRYGDKRECAALPGHIIEALGKYDWPGNVRELQNELQRYLAEQYLEFLGDLSAEFETDGDMSRDFSDLAHLELPEALEAFEKRLIASKLSQNQGCTGKTAAQLGISVRTLQRKIKRYGLCEEEQGVWITTGISNNYRDFT